MERRGTLYVAGAPLTVHMEAPPARPEPLSEGGWNSPGEWIPFGWRNRRFPMWGRAALKTRIVVNVA